MIRDTERHKNVVPYKSCRVADGANINQSFNKSLHV